MSVPEKPRSNYYGVVIAIASAAIMGVWPAATRGIYSAGGNVVFAILITTWVRALAMIFFCMLTHRSLFKTKEDTHQAIIGGFFQTLSIIGLLSALAFLPAPIVITILYTHTLMLLFFMAWRKEIGLDKLIISTTFMALVGLSLVLDFWNSKSSLSLWGLSLAFLGALATLSRLYVYGHLTQKRHPIVVGAESFLITAIFMLVIIFWQKPHCPSSVSGLVYVLIGCMAMTIGTFGMFYGVSLIGSFKWSLFSKLEPIFTALFSALLLGEILKPVQYFGIVLVVGSLVAYQMMSYGQSQSRAKE